MYRKAIEYLKEWKNRPSRKPLVIRGARQVGKSWLVREFARQEFSCLLEINLENDGDVLPYFDRAEPRETLQLLSVHFNCRVEEGATLLFLDELQAFPKLLARLRYFYEKLPNLHVIAAGSLLDFALEDHSFSMPVGRIEYLYLGPISFMEFLGARGLQELVSFLEAYNLKQQIPAPIHEKLTSYYKQFLAIGGMPESIRIYIESGSYRETERIRQSLLTTYIDDFSKYGRRISRELLIEVFRAIPHVAGMQPKYSAITRNYQAAEVARALHLLSLARVCYPVYHSASNGIPLGAQLNQKKFKILFLDVGLLNSASGLSITSIEKLSESDLVNNGGMTEQFIGQHLLYRNAPWYEPELSFWAREKQASQAEIDYVISLDSNIIGIEVKAGSTGSLKSLNQFIVEKKFPMALRFNLDLPSVCRSTGRMPAGDVYDFSLVSLPVYLVEQTERLLLEIIQKHF